MGDPGELAGGNVRVSDAQRDKVVAELRSHCLAGRISVEELERRAADAMSAVTIHQLAETVYDLPKISVATAQTAAPAKLRVGPPGVRPFTRRIVVPRRSSGPGRWRWTRWRRA